MPVVAANTTVLRIAAQPPRMATPQQRAANLANVGMVEGLDEDGNTVVLPLRRDYQQQPARLSTGVRNVSDVWQEFYHGIAGNKPLRFWTADEKKSRAVKSVYNKRRAIYDLLSDLVRFGRHPAQAIRLVEKHYGTKPIGKISQRK